MGDLNSWIRRFKYRLKWWIWPVPTAIVQVTESMQPCGVRVVVKECELAAISEGLGKTLLVGPVCDDKFLRPDIKLWSLKIHGGRGYRVTIPTPRTFCVLAAILKQASVVHLHSISTLSVMLCFTSWLLRQLGMTQAKIVYTFHVDHEAYYRCWISASLERVIIKPLCWLTNIIVRQCIKASTVTVFPSEHSRQRYKKLLGYENPITRVIGNPVGLPKSSFSPKSEQSQIAKKALHVGRIGREKNIKEVLDFWYLMLSVGFPVELNFVGNGDINKWWRYALSLSPSAEKLVRFLGHVSRSDVSRLVDESDFGIFFSNSETFGLGPFEEMKEGLPMVTLRNTCISDAVEECGGGLSVNCTIEDAKKVSSILNDEKRLKEMGMFAKQYVCNKFSREIIAPQIAGLYKELMS